MPYNHSKWMLAALQASGKPVKMVTLEQGGHSILNPAQRRQVFEELDRFLAQSLPSTS